MGGTHPKTYLYWAMLVGLMCTTGWAVLTTVCHSSASVSASNPAAADSRSTTASASTAQSPTSPVVFPGAAWAFKSPAEVGLDKAMLNQFVLLAGTRGVIVKDGYMIKTWGWQRGKFAWGSAKKPLLSTLLFFAVEEGRLSSVDDRLGDWGWQLAPDDQAMTFRHLANNVSGYARAEGPGMAWAYNDFGVSLYQNTLFTRIFASSDADAVARHPTRLGPLQFEDGSIFTDTERKRFVLQTTLRDFARIGWFWLNKGNWQGKQILPQHYFDTYMQPGVPGDLPRTAAAATDYLGVGSAGGGSDHVSFGPGVYGFNWWFNANVGRSTTRLWPDAPADTFQANGHFNGEVLTVIPSLGIVAAWKGEPSNPETAFQQMNTTLKALAEAARASDTAPPSS